MKMKTLTVEEFQKDFDALIEKVEQGESFIITSESGNAIMVPYDYATKSLEDCGVDDEILKIYTEHEEGC
jgi:PHD/YefM family antitoxin component YafN of YafNO toxin-antitoxin module